MTKAVIFDMYETLITHYNCPLYFSTEMAADAGIPVEKFQPLWRSTEYERTVGKMSFEDVITRILEENNCYSEVVLKKIEDKRTAIKEECFKHLHDEIIPMLEALKEKGIKIGLISNCFSEEVVVIRRSVLFSYFDAVCLSYEQGVQKPDKEIYLRCMDKLSVAPQECVYVGDGGSFELETAKEFGMKAVQAVWYLKDGTFQPKGRMKGFEQVERPLDILDYLSEE